MTSTAEPAMAQLIPEKTFRASLAGAKAGDLKDINIVIAYYLDNNMPDQAEFWDSRRELLKP